MSEDEDVNYFALAAVHCFGRRQDAGPAPQAVSSNASAPVQKHVRFKDSPSTSTASSNSSKPSSSVSSPEAKPKFIGNVICLGSDEEDGETGQILDSRGKRRSPLLSDPLPFIKRRQSPCTENGAGHVSGNLKADDHSDDEDDATIVLSDSEEAASDDSDDNSDTDSDRPVEIFTYDDPKYDWINPFLNENFAMNGLDVSKLLTDYLAALDKNEYKKLIGERPIKAMIRELMEYMGNTRCYQRGVRMSKRLMELIEEEEEPCLPSEKPECLKLFVADPSVKPEPPNTYPDNEPDVDGNSGII